MASILKKKTQNLFQDMKVEFPKTEMEHDYRILKEQNMVSDFKRCLMFLIVLNLVIVIITLILSSQTEFWIALGTVLGLLPVYLFQRCFTKHIQLITLIIILSYNISRLFIIDSYFHTPDKDRLFYAGYGLASLEIILLFRLLKVSQKILGMAIALFLRFFIVAVYIDPGSFDAGLFIRHLLIDGYICYTFYDHEIVFRKIYKGFVQKKEELLKFKELLAESLPQSLVVVTYTSNELLFFNKTFQTTFFNYHEIKLIQDHLSSFTVDSSTIRDTTTNSINTIPLADSKLSLSLTEIVRELSSNDFLNSKTISLAASISLSNDRKLFEVTLKKVNWDSKDAIAIIFNDITYQENLIALKLANINKDKVIATVSHELRTPLNGIIGILDIAERKVENPQIAEYLSLCKDNAYLLLSLVNSILDLQQISTGKLKLNLVSVEIRKLIHRLCKLFYFQCKEKGVSLEFSIHKDVPSSISTDENRLKQILINLIGNAIKFTFKGKVKVEVTPHPKNLESLIVSVSDTGIGIRHEDQNRLFKMYSKIEDGESVNKNGIGLGLTISNALAIMLNGCQEDHGLEIESEHGMGSRFYFEIKKDLKEIKPIKPTKSETLIGGEFAANITSERNETVQPLLLQNSEPKTEEHEALEDCFEDDCKEFFVTLDLQSKLSHYASSARIKAPLSSRFFTGNDNPQSQRMLIELNQIQNVKPSSTISDNPLNFEANKMHDINVLIVDDNPFNLLVAKNIIQEFGCKIQTVLGGQEAIDLVKSNLSEGRVFKVIFMDCQMPVMDGFETTQILNRWIKSGEIPDVAIFGWTANNGEADVKRCYEVGMRGHLPKPTSKSDFLRILSGL